MHWQTRRFRIDLSAPRVMGIVNVTPDSFSDGGRYADQGSALAQCERLLAEGADILDIGGSSSRPGATQPDAAEELRRVLPVLREAVALGVPLSIDTCAPLVMQAALDVGVDIVNDIHALEAPGAVDCLARHPNAGVCLMHMRGEPDTMSRLVQYGDVVAEVRDYLGGRAQALIDAGIGRERIAIDPGIGFAKTDAHNLALLARQSELLALGYPLLVGWSRKRTLGQITGRPVGERQAASVAAALAAVLRGAQVLRVHDVAATVDALAVWRAAARGGPA
ncbi:MAG: dihydropteroate synthase [Burkholderiales bacterium]|nr:dihydropteroate synthase [Burkholderiales bacterium]MDE1926467.1 dihydropteroate synthase [Burkholderiales bacterium]MDE2160538.1 dihydropteroate synthase [Burkholderiales bacterium]MDE2503502.1 dihydropteroate synthase [Burkholderiales bacterium]